MNIQTKCHVMSERELLGYHHLAYASLNEDTLRLLSRHGYAFTAIHRRGEVDYGCSPTEAMAMAIQHGLRATIIEPIRRLDGGKNHYYVIQLNSLRR